jgi:trehalose 6-phosphate synthase
MRAMRRTVSQNDVAAWADSFMEELAAVRPSHGKTVRPARRS